jgi:hypothetical protein
MASITTRTSHYGRFTMSRAGCILNDRLASNLELAEVARHLVDFVKVQTQRHQAVPGDANATRAGVRRPAAARVPVESSSGAAAAPSWFSYRMAARSSRRGPGRCPQRGMPSCCGPSAQTKYCCMAHRKTMITMGSPDFVWINANEIISSWYLLGAVCVAPPAQACPNCYPAAKLSAAVYSRY